MSMKQPSNHSVLTTLTTITQNLQDILKSTPFDEYLTIHWVSTPIKLTGPRFGANDRLDKNNFLVLELSQELLSNHRNLLEPVIWRESYLLYLPRSIREVPEASDLGLFCYYKYGIKSSKRRQKFLQIWETTSPSKDYIFYRYHPSAGFKFFDDTVDGTFLKMVLQWLAPFQQASIPISSKVYTANLERWMFNYHRILKSVELKVLRGLEKCPNCTQNELAEHLNLRQPTISRIIRNLAQKHLMRLIVFQNFPVFGLHPIAVKFPITQIKTQNKLRKLLARIRYTLGIQEFDDCLLGFFVIPSRRFQRFTSWIKQLNAAWNLPTPKILFLVERTTSRNFGLYDPKNNGWPLDYNSILDNISRVIQEDWTQQLPQLRSFKLSRLQVPAIKLAPEDFIYMQRATDAYLLTCGPRFSEAQEALLAGFSESEHMAYRRRVDFLQNNKVISSPLGVGIWNIGLDAVVNVFIQSSIKESRRILTAFQLLPHVGGNILDDGCVSATLLVPKTFAVAIKVSLKTLLTDFTDQISIVTKPGWEAHGWRVQYPVNSANYDFEKGDWVWIKDTLPIIQSL